MAGDNTVYNGWPGGLLSQGISSMTTNSTNWQIRENNPAPANLNIQGTAIFGGDVIIKGRSLDDTLDKIEERLAILRPNPALEDKWGELKELGDKYRALEAEIIEKQKIWDILNK